MTGKFLAIEGIDGAGKTTVAGHIQRFLVDQGIEAVLTREPTRGPIGDVIRRSLGDLELHPYQRALLFAADRYGHLKDVIAPALEAGKWVVTDRYLYSSLAYQGAEGVDMAFLRFINGFAPDPDIVLYLDVLPDIGVSRLQKRDRFEDSAFLRTVRATFAEILPRHALHIDAAQPLKEVLAVATGHVKRSIEGGR
ncbi:MAG: dTMP kinase [Thermoplasmata archaeon]|nr:dTMP kinase [Thermoplasmata archaeon]